MKTKWNAYLRRSKPYKDKDGKLVDIEPFSIEVQRRMINGIVPEEEIEEEFVEIETATGHKQRNKFELAIESCIVKKRNLICAKFDRFSREGIQKYFEYKKRMRDYGLDILIAEFPYENEMIEAVMAGSASMETKRMSERIRDGMRIAKEKGTKTGRPIGNPILFNNPEKYNKYRKKGAGAMREKSLNDQSNMRARRLIQSLKENGKTYDEIVEELNKSGYKTSRGNSFSKSTVSFLYHQTA